MTDDTFDRFTQRIAFIATRNQPVRVASSMVFDALKSIVGLRSQNARCCVAKGGCSAAGNGCLDDFPFCCESMFICHACNSRIDALGLVTENAVACCLPWDARCRRGFREACKTNIDFTRLDSKLLS